MLSSNSEIRKSQQTIQDILSGSKIEFTAVDVAANRDDLNKMREVVGNPTALAPQIANGDVYCGDFEAFQEAVENKALKEFLKLPSE
ncbi:Sh3 domain-binding glutamic acid-rich-like protein [Plakobranchus ocellatus]|uniref:Sh3 domain-binding glutamic acid-rich-like protein n=1 Tax=Plakobranchus ocellatus TaxID=259542 RepID=A0AAV3Y4J2_9GAST|nr:Sh3 domain-binding glutamic acid-rich-like protein [Plakobranchus ocellatus]